MSQPRVTIDSPSLTLICLLSDLNLVRKNPMTKDTAIPIKNPLVSGQFEYTDISKEGTIKTDSINSRIPRTLITIP